MAKSHMDLHLHSSVSLDGEISPRGLAELCKQEGISLAALTDHNSISGVPEFSWRGAQLGVRVIPGIELDCLHDALNLHMLGYGIDISNEKLKQIEYSVFEMQRAACLQQMDAVEDLGILLNRDKLIAHAKNGIVSAEMVGAEALSFPNNQNHPLLQPFFSQPGKPLADFYWDICAPGKPAYVPIPYISAHEAIEVIHNAGGIAVLAHPGISLKNQQNIEQYFQHLPIDGIEVFSSYHGTIQTAFYLKLAQRYHLLITGGSDFHGENNPHAYLGQIDMLDMEDALRMDLFSALL